MASLTELQDLVNSTAQKIKKEKRSTQHEKQDSLFEIGRTISQCTDLGAEQERHEMYWHIYEYLNKVKLEGPEPKPFDVRAKLLEIRGRKDNRKDDYTRFG